MGNLLSNKDIKSNLSNISGWVFEENKIKRVIQLDTYMASIDLVRSIAKKAEQINHHPEWENVYNKVIIIYVFPAFSSQFFIEDIIIHT